MLKKKINLSKRKSILLGIIILILGISLFSYDYFKAKKSYAFEYMNNKLYLSYSEIPEYLDFEEDEKGVTTDNLTVEKKEETVNKKNSNNNGYYYIGYLEIPKIKFKRGLLILTHKITK